jgi:hypothetical protein
MLSAAEQDFVRQSVETARTAGMSEDPAEVRRALEQLENAARMITDAMFRPGDSNAPNDGEQSEQEQAAPLSEVS